MNRGIAAGVLALGCLAASASGQDQPGDQPADAPTAPAHHPHSPFVGDRVKRQHARGGGVPAAIEAALGFLQRRQAEDGGWTDDTGPVHRSGLTALAVLCFLAEGSSHVHGEHRPVIAKALAFVRGSQGEEGRFGGESRPGYDTALCTLALAEAYTYTLDDELRAPVENAVRALAAARTWGYAGSPERGELPLAAWGEHALVVARRAGIRPREYAVGGHPLSRAAEVLEDGGYVGYDGVSVASSEVSVAHGLLLDSRKRYLAMALGPKLLGGAVGSRTNAENRAKLHHAASLLVLDDPSIEALLEARVKELRWDWERLDEEATKRGGSAYHAEHAEAARIRLEVHMDAMRTFEEHARGKRLGAGDEHYAYWASLACWQLGGPYWRAWLAYEEPAHLAAAQVTSGEDRGAFEPRSPLSTGKVCATALRCLALQAPYRYLRAGDQLAQRPKLPKPKKK